MAIPDYSLNISMTTNRREPFFLFIKWDEDDHMTVRHCTPLDRLKGPEFLRARYGCDLVLIGFRVPDYEFEVIRHTERALEDFQLMFRSLERDENSHSLYRFTSGADLMLFRLIWEPI
jgi:hypothetical protein